MNNLVFLDNKEVYTDSIKVAEVFNKKHKNVLRDIERIILHAGCNLGRLRFEPTNYRDSQNKTFTKYLLCKDALMLLVMGYSGPKALDMKLKYISEFNKMSSFINEQHSIQNQLLDAIKKEDISFSNGSSAGRSLQRRKIEKQILKERIEELNSMLQIDWLKDLRIN